MSGSDPASPPSFTCAELAGRIGARLAGAPAADRVRITGLAGVDEARAGDLTFISERRYAERWPQSLAAAAVVREGLEPALDASRPLMVVRDVDLAMITLLQALAPPDHLPEPGVHAAAIVDPAARLGRQVRIGPHVSVGPNVVLGDGVILHPGVRLYAGAHVGDGSILHANTVVRERCIIGRGVILHANVSIGTDGFGYRPAPDGRGLLKMPHVGTVVIEDGVEIGSGTSVDRAKFGATVIGAGTKIDNQVQIAHNCRIGRCCVLAGQAGLAGSVTLGDGVVMGGGAGVVEHITIGAGARVGAVTLVTRDVPPGATVMGLPADDAQATLRQWASIRRLPGLIRRLSALDPAADRLREPAAAAKARREGSSGN